MSERVLQALFPLLALFALQQLGSAAIIHGKAWMAPVLVERAWTRSLSADGEAVRPWPWADTWPVAKLTFPERGVTRLVLAGDSGSALAFGPGHSPASVRPGQQGESVISGHRDTHFAFLAQVQPGESLQLQLPSGQLRHYRVDDITIVDSSSEHLQRSTQWEQLRLVTCYPFEAALPGGPLRYVVTAVPLSDSVAAVHDRAKTRHRLHL